MKFVEMFAGIGGMSHGLEQAGMECVAFAEWDKYAHKAYNILHNKDNGKVAWKDVTEVTERDLLELRERTGGIDLLAAGFPCQSFSIAGKRLGFEDTRGTLFFDVARWIKTIRPTYLLLENVKGLLNHDSGRTFTVIIQTLDELGYDVQWQVLNSKNFGVPQNRERVFIVGHSRTASRPKVFPIRRENSSTLGSVGLLDMKGDESIRRVYSEDGILPALTTMQGGHREPKIMVENKNVRAIMNPEIANKSQNGRRAKDVGEEMFTLTGMDRHGVIIPINPSKPDGSQYYHQDCVFDVDGIMPALTSIVQNVGLPIKEATKQGYKMAYEGDSVNYTQPNSQTRRGRVGNGIANTLETKDNQGVVTNDYRIRKLTPLECFRLQSFPDEWYHELVNNGFSNTQLYKMAGNAVTSNVVKEIARRIIHEKDDI